MGLGAHHIGHGAAQHLVHLPVPRERIAQIDHRIEQHHVGACIEAAFANHQVGFGELTHQLTRFANHRQSAHMVLAHQLHRLLKGRSALHGEHRAAHHLRHRPFHHHPRILPLRSPHCAGGTAALKGRRAGWSHA